MKDTIKAVIFDLDQTLLDRRASLLGFLEWQCAGMLRPYLKDKEAFLARFIELDANGTVWKDRVYETLVREFDLGDWTVGELLSVYENCFSSFCMPMAGASGVLEVLSQSYEIGLISNGMSPFQERNFRALEFAPLFKSVIISQAVDLRKPDLRIFHRGCADLGVIPAEAVYVGDNPIADIQGAHDAGLRTVYIPGDSPSICPFADATCHDMTQLPRIIQQLAL